jgi:putative flippase GtrA
LARLLGITRQFLQYATIGALCASVDVLIFNLLLSIGIETLFANFSSTSCGILLSYTINSKITFRSFAKFTTSPIRYATVGIIGILITSSILLLFVNQLEFDPMWVKIVTIPLVAVTQFLLNKNWSFKYRANPEI